MPVSPRASATTPLLTGAPARSLGAQPSRVPARPRRGRRWVLVAVVLAALVAGAGVFDRVRQAGDDLRGGSAGDDVVVRAQPPAVAGPVPDPPPAPREPGPDLTPAPVLALGGDFPASGPGTFTVVESEGEVLGESGPLLRYRVAVEDGIEIDEQALAGFVDQTLGHPQGWTAGGERRFQRVEEGHDFTIYLATSGTTEQMCATGGLVVSASGLPDGGVSCRLSGKVILNLSRWRLSVPHFVDAEVPLVTYRRMLINHEVGHQLGFGHAGCPGAGEPAPVMQQQTISLDGCEANPWPYPEGEYYSGPPAN